MREASGGAGLVAVPIWSELLWPLVYTACTGVRIFLQELTYQCHLGASPLKIKSKGLYTRDKKLLELKDLPRRRAREGINSRTSKFHLTLLTCRSFINNKAYDNLNVIDKFVKITYHLLLFLLQNKRYKQKLRLPKIWLAAVTAGAFSGRNFRTQGPVPTLYCCENQKLRRW